jgi:hypothetical protein
MPTYLWAREWCGRRPIQVSTTRECALDIVVDMDWC